MNGLIRLNIKGRVIDGLTFLVRMYIAREMLSPVVQFWDRVSRFASNNLGPERRPQHLGILIGRRSSLSLPHGSSLENMCQPRLQPISRDFWPFLEIEHGFLIDLRAS